MFHRQIEPGRDPAIHPAWCTCSDCQDDVQRRRALRGDLLAVTVGLAAGFAAIGVIYAARVLAPIVARIAG